MKKIITVILTAIMLICISPLSASAEKSLKAPTVQYKLVNHDEIALRWTEVEGADGYCIYRTDVETGKTVRYKNIVKGTTVEVKGLTAESEYIFQVAAVSESNGQTAIGKKSRGTKLTTPKEWYYEPERKYIYVKFQGKKTYIEYYKQHYDGTEREWFPELDYADSSGAVSHDGWVYFTKNGSIGRVREDGTDKEILLDDLYDNDIFWYEFYGKYLYIFRSYEYYINYLYKNDEDISPYSGHHSEQRMYTEISDLRRIALDNEDTEIEEIIDLSDRDRISVGFFEDSFFYVSRPLLYDNESKLYYIPMGSRIKDNKYHLCKIKNDGNDNEVICEVNEKVAFSNIYVYDNELYFYKNDIYKCPISGGEAVTLCEVKDLGLDSFYYADDFEIVNDYIYFTAYEHGDYEWKDKGYYHPAAYYRMKTDGSGLTKGSTPFEWRY